MRSEPVIGKQDGAVLRKTIIAIAVILSASLLLISAAPASDADTTGECGIDLTWELTENVDDPGTYTLTIAGTGTAMNDYTSTSHPGWYDNNTTITNLVLPVGLTHIGSYAFYNLPALAETNISELDSLESIGEGAFAGTAITSMNLSGTDLTTVADNTFWQCRSLTSVELPTTVTSIGTGAFSATGLQNINFVDLTGLTSIGASAFEASSITSADLLSTQLTSIADGAFHFNDSLTSVTIPATVTTIGAQSFNECGALTTLNVPENSALTTIGANAFSATGFTSVDLSNATGLTTLGDNAFGDCPSLTEVTVPETFTLPTSAFEGSPVEGLWTVSVGDRYFDSLAEAFYAAEDGDTITLLKSVEISSYIMLSDGRNLTLDLGDGNNISSSTSFAIFIAHGGLEIEGTGTISVPMTMVGAIGISGSTDPGATDYSTLVVGSGVTLQGYWGLDVQETSTGNGTVYGIVVDIYGRAVGLTDTSASGYHGGALYVTGNIHGYDGNLPVINIHDYAVITGNDDALGIYGAGQAIWNIDAATISGSTGIELRNGTLNIDGAIVKSTVDSYSVIENGSGRTTTGAAIAITTYYSTEEDTPTMEIVSGSFTGPVAVSQTNPNSVANAMYDLSILGGTFTSTGTNKQTSQPYPAVISSEATGFIAGGTYYTNTNQPDTSLNEGLLIDPSYDVNGSGVVEPDTAVSVAYIKGGKYFTTLQAAINDASEGQTVILLMSVTEAITIPADKAVVIDLNNHKISVNNGPVITNNGKLTIQNATSTTDAMLEVVVGNEVGIVNNGNLTIRNVWFSTGSGIVSNAGMLTVGEGVWFDGFDASDSFAVTVNGGTAVIEGGYVDDDYDYGIIINDGAVNPPSDIRVELNKGDYGGKKAGVQMNGANVSSVKTEFVMTGGSVRGVGNNAIGFAGNGAHDYTEITISGGSITSPNQVALFHPQIGDLTITDGTITGYTGVQFCGEGSITISGGTITGTGECVPTTKDPTQTSGTFDDGAALSLISRGSAYQPSGKMDVTITGGTFVSENASAVQSYRIGLTSGDTPAWATGEDSGVSSSLGGIAVSEGDFTSADGFTDITCDSSESEVVTVSGGDFSSDVSSFLEPGLELTENPDGSFTAEQVTLKLTEDSVTMFTGGENYTIQTAGGYEWTGLTYTSSNPSVATVENGVITAAGAGTATVTVSFGEQSDTITVTVQEYSIGTGHVLNPITGSQMTEIEELLASVEGVPWAAMQNPDAFILDIGHGADASNTFTLLYGYFGVSEDDGSAYTFYAVHILANGGYEVLIGDSTSQGVVFTASSMSPFYFTCILNSQIPVDVTFTAREGALITVTGANGTWTVDHNGTLALIPGTYTATAALEGYTAEPVEFTVRIGTPATVDVPMTQVEEPEPEPGPVYPPFIPDDDPPYIPPTIVVEEGNTGDDDESVKIAACAAAAVAAAIIAAFLIMDYRRR